jgi:hypothetical protein
MLLLGDTQNKSTGNCKYTAEDRAESQSERERERERDFPRFQFEL